MADISSQFETSDLHVHSNWSDGQASILDMARAAADLGCTAIAITDHSWAYHRDPERFVKGREEEARTAEDLTGIRVLAGIEVDILPSGGLDVEIPVLSLFGWVIAAPHSGTATISNIERMLSACVPNVSMIGHPFCYSKKRRKLLCYDSLPLFVTAAVQNIRIEINGARMDISEDMVKAALRARWGIRFVATSDAHSPAALADRQKAVDFLTKCKEEL